MKLSQKSAAVRSWAEPGPGDRRHRGSKTLNNSMSEARGDIRGAIDSLLRTPIFDAAVTEVVFRRAVVATTNHRFASSVLSTGDESQGSADRTGKHRTIWIL